MFKNNKNLLIIALIAVVNALGYGIIIPILYSYSKKYGLSDFQNGILFATFSLCQFFSTPIIGRLSDKFGRKPLLIISISGTVISFIMMAFAPSALFLFLARALDGITAGNIPVASAVITDTTEPKDRAKGFGIIGAAFGFGFIFGPAVSAATVGISTAIPFLIAAAISLLAVIITALFLPETNKNMGKLSHAKLFDLKKLASALTNKTVGSTLLLTLFYFMAFSMFIFGFQSSTVEVLHMSASGIALLFSLFGVLGLISQLFLLPRALKYFKVKKALLFALIWVTITFAVMFFTRSIVPFVIASVALGLINNFVQPITQTILSEETDETEQGEMQGINTSYMSIGQILGPIIAGAAATLSNSAPFIGASVLSAICIYLAIKIFSHKELKLV